MIQRGKNACFTLKSCDTIFVMRERFRKEFDGDASAERQVRGLVYVTHSARTQVTRDFVMCELVSDHDVLKFRSGSLSDAASLNFTVNGD
jgi:hypothetical protein